MAGDDNIPLIETGANVVLGAERAFDAATARRGPAG